MKLKFFALTALTALCLTAVAELPQNLEFKSIAVGLDGTLWVGTNMGLYHKPQTDELQKHPETPTDVTVSDIAINTLTAATPEATKMLLATTKGAALYELNESALSLQSTYTPDKQVLSVALDNDGSAWVATTDSFYIMKDNQLLDIRYKGIMQEAAIKSFRIVGIGLSEQSAIVVTERPNYCVEIFNKEVDGCTGATTIGKYEHGSCQVTDPACMVVCQNGEQWYGSKENGVHWQEKPDYHAASLTISKDEGLLDNQVNAIAASPNGVTAYAGTAKGVSVVTRNDATGSLDDPYILSVTKNYSFNADNNSNGIVDIAVGPDNKVYAISDKELYVLDDPIAVSAEKTTIKADAITIAPNPASEVVNITIEHNRPAKAQINLLSSKGVMVRQLFDGEVGEGIQTLTLPLDGVMPGNYICSLNIGNDYYASVLIVK